MRINLSKRQARKIYLGGGHDDEGRDTERRRGQKLFDNEKMKTVDGGK